MTTTLLLLAAAILLQHLAGERAWSPVPVLLLAMAAGLDLPDLDQVLPLAHRSALTHSLLPAALALGQRRWWPLAAGLGWGTAMHLAADTFPNAMRGYATVKLPLLGSIGAGPSYAWLALNALAGGLIGLWLAGTHLAGRTRWVVLAAMGLSGCAYLLNTDGGWAALALLVGIGGLALRGKRQPG